MSRPLRLVVLGVLAAGVLASGPALAAECVPTEEIVGDGIDQDCDGHDSMYWYLDEDGDGYGTDEGTAVVGIDTGPGANESANMLDCVDSGSVGGLPAAEINPAQTEIWYDGVDQDCDGDNDFDWDHDGYVHEDFDSKKGGTAPYTGDCDDDPASGSAVNPGASEVPDDAVDQNCNGYDQTTWILDADEDGYGTDEMTFVLVDGPAPADVSATADDCDDSDSLINPDAVDTPDDAIDQNCNGYDATTWILDADEDGFGNDAGMTVIADGPQPSNGVTTWNDCDDSDPTVNPAANEIWYDGIDQDCDGANDFDWDRDGFVIDEPSYSPVPGGTAPYTGDCDDDPASGSSINPGATEVTDDGVDQDCDGRELFYVDADDDGYRPDTVSTALASGMTIESGLAHADEPTGDCNDGIASIHPNAAEIVADGIDQDCDGGDDFYLDADDDGYGTTTVVSGASLSDGANESIVSTDCDDGDASIHPDAEDIAGDGIDQNCDGEDAEAPAVTTTTTSTTTTTTLPPASSTTSTGAAPGSSTTGATTTPATGSSTTSTTSMTAGGTSSSTTVAAFDATTGDDGPGSGPVFLLLGLTLFGAGAGAALWFFRFR